MTLTGDRAALAGALEPIGLPVLLHEPDEISETCLIIGNPTGTYGDDFEGDYTRTFPVVLLLGLSAGSVNASETIDPYIDTTGTKSVPAAIRTLANAVAVGFSNFGGGYTLGGKDYAGVTFEVHLL